MRQGSYLAVFYFGWESGETVDTSVINYELKDLPLDVVEADKEQPRDNPNNPIALKGLKTSVAKHGIQQPITVTETTPGRFIIIDGHRRYYCAKELNFEAVPCLIYPNLSPGEFEVRRYAMQNLRRPWKPLERADSLNRMKDTLGCKSARELALQTGLSESATADYLHLRDQQLHLLHRLADRDLNPSFQTEIVRLKPHLRKVAGLEADEIINIILDRINNDKISGNIKNSKEMRIIKSAFIRIDLYGDVLATYLRDPEMRVKELEEQTLRNGFSWDMQKAVATMAKKKASGEKFTDKEQDVVRQIVKLGQEIMSD